MNFYVQYGFIMSCIILTLSWCSCEKVFVKLCKFTNWHAFMKLKGTAGLLNCLWCISQLSTGFVCCSVFWQWIKQPHKGGGYCFSLAGIRINLCISVFLSLSLTHTHTHTHTLTLSLIFLSPSHSSGVLPLNSLQYNGLYLELWIILMILDVHCS